MLVREEQLCKIDSNATKDKMKESNYIKLQQRLVNSVSLSSSSVTEGGIEPQIIKLYIMVRATLHVQPIGKTTR